MTSTNRHYIDQFFANYPTFNYKSDAPLLKEFQRLSRQQGWNPYERQQERDKLKNAMVLQFNHTYGKDENDLTSWQQLCRTLGANPIPDNIAECRTLLGRTHVNLVDFIEEPGTPIEIFSSEVELSEYTQEEGKYFPRNNVNAGSLLTCLLRHIHNPSMSRGRDSGDPGTSGAQGRGQRGRGRGQGRARRRGVMT